MGSPFTLKAKLSGQLLKIMPINDKNVSGLTEIEAFVGSNKKFTVKIFAWGVGNNRDI